MTKFLWESAGRAIDGEKRPARNGTLRRAPAYSANMIVAGRFCEAANSPKHRKGSTSRTGFEPVRATVLIATVGTF